MQGIRQASIADVVQHIGLLGGGLHHGLGPHFQGRPGPFGHLVRHPQWGDHDWYALRCTHCRVLHLLLYYEPC